MLRQLPVAGDGLYLPNGMSKGLRNGPCGGSTPEHCYVDETRPCIWYRIYSRAEKMGRLERLMEVLPPLDWDKTGTSREGCVYSLTWRLGGVKSVWHGIRQPAEKTPARVGNAFFMKFASRIGGAGDALPHPAPETCTGFRLEEAPQQRQVCRHR